MSRADSIVVGPLVQELAAKPQEEQLRLLIEYLGTRSQAKVALAAHILTGGGPPIILRLIREAFAPGRRPTHAVQLLGIVGRIGGPVPYDEWMLIAAGRASPRRLVSVKCSQLLLPLGHAVASPEASRLQKSEGGTFFSENVDARVRVAMEVRVLQRLVESVER